MITETASYPIEKNKDLMNSHLAWALLNFHCWADINNLNLVDYFEKRKGQFMTVTGIFE